MLGVLSYKKQSDKPTNALSSYQASNDVRELTYKIKGAYEDGLEIQNRPFPELNNRSPLQRADEDQMAWLSWTPEPYEGEDDWRWNGVRPITRNRVISTAAHLTSQLLIPQAFAQNEFQEEDRAAANVMRDMIEYNIKRSNYTTAFLFGVISGLVNPVSYFKVDYSLGWQQIWDGDALKEVVDDVYSGFQHSLVPIEDVLISNPYEFEFQKQDYIIEKEYISYGQAMAECGDHPNFIHVQEGKKVILHDDGMFYDVDDVNDSLIEKVVYKCRRSDQEVKFLGGVYMGSDNVDYNPMIHRSNKNKPKYNLVKYGYEPIDEMKFYYYKSLVAKMSNDQEAADRQWQMYFDASFLNTFPPTITMGAGKIDRSVITPAANTDLPPDAKIEFLRAGNPDVALQALREAERSLTESSQDPQSSGIQQGPQKTARESILLERNKETQLGLAAKMIGVMVQDVGNLLVDNIIRYQTIGELSEITGEMTYKTFILDGKIKGGKEKSSYIRFTDRYAGRTMSEKERMKEELKMFENAGDNQDIYEVNPYAFARMDYLITIDAEEALQRNDAFERAFKLETYDRAIANPLVQQDPEALQKITRDFLFEPLMKGEASKYLPNISRVASSLVPSEESGGGMTSRITQSAGLESLLA